MKVKTVLELEPGESFIWLDDETRRFMCAYDDRNKSGGRYRRLQVLKCTDVNPYIVHFTYLNGEPDSLFYQQDSKVIIVHEGHSGELKMNLYVTCNGCDRPLGDHYTGYGAKRDGVCCRKPKSGEWFVPNEESLREYHPEAFETSDDFFASLGL